MPEPFSPLKIGKLEIKNRFMRSATWDGTADEQGRVTDASVQVFRDLARGGVGLIVTGHAFVSRHGQAGKGQLGIYSDDMIPGLRRLSETVHAFGGKIALQMSHSGLNTRFHAARGAEALAPSVKEGHPAPHRALTDSEIEGIIANFGSAVVRAREAGIDAIQLHGAHGFLMSQFLSPLFNRRTDKWGGTAENRRHFHTEVVKEVRRRVGRDYPVLIKFGVMDDQEGGATLEEGIETARDMVAAGLDGIEVSGGFGRSRQQAEAANKSGDAVEPFFRERTVAVKKAVRVPTMEVGGIRTLAMARAILASGEADMVSLSRPLIREPGLIARWEREDQSAARCISCSRCFWTIEHESSLGCYQDRHPEGNT